MKPNSGLTLALSRMGCSVLPLLLTFCYRLVFEFRLSRLQPIQAVSVMLFFPERVACARTWLSLAYRPRNESSLRGESSWSWFFSLEVSSER